MQMMISLFFWYKTSDIKLLLNESEVIIMLFGICLIVFIGLCIYHACEKELPADYHNNWRLEAEDSQKVREGKMTQRQFEKNMNNGKYR